jgi:hypothetical protein
LVVGEWLIDFPVIKMTLTSIKKHGGFVKKNLQTDHPLVKIMSM